MLRLHSTSFKSVFRIHSDIYNGVFCKRLLTIFTKKLDHICSTGFKICL